MTQLQSMSDAAYRLDEVKGGVLNTKILIGDITREVSHFSEDADNAHPELAQLFLMEAQSKLRLIAKLLQAAEKDINRDFEQLNEVSSNIFDQVVHGEKEDINKRATILKFEKENGREPADEKELRKWLTDFMKIANERAKKA